MDQFLTQSDDKLDGLLDNLGLARMSDLEVRFINEYVEAMEPLSRALDILQGEQRVYIGYLIPTIYSLKVKLRRKETKLYYCVPLIRALLNDVEIKI